MSAAMAESMVRDDRLGAVEVSPGPEQPVIVLVGEVGVGKSLAGERLHQRALAVARDDPGAPVPLWLRARDAGGDLVAAVDALADRFGGSPAGAVAVTVDGLDKPARAGPRSCSPMPGGSRAPASDRRSC